jgi:hypothetical protein
MRHRTPADTDLTVGELIGMLTEHHPDTLVRLAVQPACPFAYALAPMTAADTDTEVVYLAAGEQLSYLPNSAGSALADAGDPRWTSRT